MKTLKFNHKDAELVIAGEKTSTWRLYDDKDLSVDDEIKFIDKVDPKDSKTWQVIGEALVSEVREKKLENVTKDDMDGHVVFSSPEDMLNYYKDIYGERVTLDTPVKIVFFKFTPVSGELPQHRPMSSVKWMTLL
jgi:hypothetical protein